MHISFLEALANNKKEKQICQADINDILPNSTRFEVVLEDDTSRLANSLWKQACKARISNGSASNFCIESSYPIASLEYDRLLHDFSEDKKLYSHELLDSKKYNSSAAAISDLLENNQLRYLMGLGTQQYDIELNNTPFKDNLTSSKPHSNNGENPERFTGDFSKDSSFYLSTESQSHCVSLDQLQTSSFLSQTFLSNPAVCEDEFGFEQVSTQHAPKTVSQNTQPQRYTDTDKVVKPQKILRQRDSSSEKKPSLHVIKKFLIRSGEIPDSDNSYKRLRPSDDRMQVADHKKSEPVSQPGQEENHFYQAISLHLYKPPAEALKGSVKCQKLSKSVYMMRNKLLNKSKSNKLNLEPLELASGAAYEEEQLPTTTSSKTTTDTGSPSKYSRKRSSNIYKERLYSNAGLSKKLFNGCYPNKQSLSSYSPSSSSQSSSGNVFPAPVKPTSIISVNVNKNKPSCQLSSLSTASNFSETEYLASPRSSNETMISLLKQQPQVNEATPNIEFLLSPCEAEPFKNRSRMASYATVAQRGLTPKLIPRNTRNFSNRPKLQANAILKELGIPTQPFYIQQNSQFNRNRSFIERHTLVHKPPVNPTSVSFTKQ